jgi:CheY-like chemotaxis protein
MALRRGNDTILVVEDEAGIRELAGQFLKAHGYTVLEAKDGKDRPKLDHPGGPPCNARGAENCLCKCW